MAKQQMSQRAIFVKLLVTLDQHLADSREFSVVESVQVAL